MGKKYIIDETTLTDIANGIRETINDLDAKYKPEDMRQKINDVYFKAKIEGYDEGEIDGFSDGYVFGKADGYDEGHTHGYEAGKITERYDFWNKYQLGGTVMGYGSANYMFAGPRWNDETFHPMFDINLSGAATQALFTYNACTNIKQRLEECGVKITSTSSVGITSLAQLFVSTQTKELPPIYNVKPPSSGNGISMQRFAERSAKLVEVPYYEFFDEVGDFTQAFSDCASLARVVGIDFSSATTASKCFTNCTKLTDITVYGEIPVSISFAQSPLTRESALSVINHLKDISGTGTTLTVTFSSTTKALLTDEDKAIATQKGWTIA